MLSTRTDLTCTLSDPSGLRLGGWGLDSGKPLRRLRSSSGAVEGREDTQSFYGKGRAINGNVSRECFMEETSPEPDLEGQRGLAKVEESGELFQDTVVLEAKVSVACSWDDDIGPVRARQASLSDWGEIRYIKDFLGGSDSKASVYNAGDLGSIPGSGRSPGEGNGNLLQYSCLENPMDGRAWWAIVHGVAKESDDLVTT